jgi:Tfp pilus assembly protein PilF
MIKALKQFNTNNYIRLAASCVFIFALLIFGAALYPAGWNWGFHFLAFYSIEIVIVIPLFMFLVIIPAVQEYCIAKVSLFHHWFTQQHRLLRVALTAAALGGIVLLFWLFRVRSYFLGDGQLIIRSMQNLASADDLVEGYKREPLIGFCIILLANLFIFLKRSNPTADAYIWLSIVSGICFLIAAWRLVKYFSEDRIEQYLLFILLMTTGISQLFFGYIENYSPAAAGVTLFLLFGVAYLRGTISIVWAVVVYGLIVMLHFGAVVFLPAFAFIVYIGAKRKQAGELGASLFLAGVIFFVLMQLSRYPWELLREVFGGTGRHIVAISLPLNKFQAYDLFSMSHVLDIANFFLLNYPSFLILLVLLCVMILKHRPTMPMETRFLLLSAFCGIGFIVILNCEIGMSRDWDILAPISLGIPLAVVALWESVDCEKRLRRRVLMMLCAVSLLHTGLWVGVNSDESKAVERFKILEDDRLWSKHAHVNAYEELAAYYRDRGDYEKAIQYFQKYNSLDSTNMRIWGNLADAFQQAGDKKKVMEVYKTMIQRGMGNYQIVTNYAICLADEQRFSEALVLFKRAEEYAPMDPIVKYDIGKTIMDSKQSSKQALSYFLTAIQIDTSFSLAYQKAVQCYLLLGDSANAKHLFFRYQRLSR